MTRRLREHMSLRKDHAKNVRLMDMYMTVHSLSMMSPIYPNFKDTTWRNYRRIEI